MNRWYYDSLDDYHPASGKCSDSPGIAPGLSFCDGDPKYFRTQNRRRPAGPASGGCFDEHVFRREFNGGSGTVWISYCALATEAFK